MAGLGLVATMAVTPHAVAVTSDVIHGGCFYESDQNGLSTGLPSVGVIGDFSVTTTGDSPPAPMGATVTCWLDVNGVPAPGTTHTYGDLAAPVQAGTDPVSYQAGPQDQVDMCQAVTFADGTGTNECFVATGDTLPPLVVIDIANSVLDTAFGVVDPFVVEPLVCPVLSSLRGNYGPVIVANDGDLYLVDPFSGLVDLLYDCPPYLETT